MAINHVWGGVAPPLWATNARFLQLLQIDYLRCIVYFIVAFIFILGGGAWGEATSERLRLQVQFRAAHERLVQRGVVGNKNEIVYSGEGGSEWMEGMRYPMYVNTDYLRRPMYFNDIYVTHGVCMNTCML